MEKENYNYNIGLHGKGRAFNCKRVIEPGTDPYSFFEDIVYAATVPQVRTRPDGYIYICDKEDKKTGHVKDEKGKTRWVAKYGKPTPFFAHILRNEGISPYELGGCEIIKWDDGRTLMVVKADDHIFNIWMCLDVPVDRRVEFKKIPLWVSK